MGEMSNENSALKKEIKKNEFNGTVSRFISKRSKSLRHYRSKQYQDHDMNEIKRKLKIMVEDL